MKKKKDQPPATVHSDLKEFMQDLESQVSVYQPTSDFKYLIKFKHPTKVNKFINVDENLVLFSILGLDFNFNPGDPTSGVAKVRFFAAFTNYDRERLINRIIFPPETRFSRCPMNHEEHSRFTFNVKTGKFFDKAKLLDIDKYIQSRANWQILSLRPILGAPLRFFRIVRWYLIGPVLRQISWLTKKLHFFFTGESYSSTVTEKPYFLYQKQETTFEILNTTNTSGPKVKILNYEFSPQPLIAFSIVHLVAFIILYILGGTRGIVGEIVDKPALTTIYAVSVFAILFYAVGSIFRWISIASFRGAHRNANPRTKRYTVVARN